MTDSTSKYVRQGGKRRADGRVRIDDLQGRELRVHTWGRTNTLFPDGVMFVPTGQEVVLKSPPGIAVTGTAVWSDGDVLAAASAVVTGQGMGMYVTAIDRDGRFTVRIPEGAAGPFNVRVSFVLGDRKTFVYAARDFAHTDRDIRIELKR